MRWTKPRFTPAERLVLNLLYAEEALLMAVLDDIAAVGAKVDKLTTDFDNYVAKKDAPATAAVATVAAKVDALDTKITDATAAVTPA